MQSKLNKIINIFKPFKKAILISFAITAFTADAHAFIPHIYQPNNKELEKRIRNRGTDSNSAISRRLLRAKEELSAQKEFDAIVINDNIDKAFSELLKK